MPSLLVPSTRRRYSSFVYMASAIEFGSTEKDKLYCIYSTYKHFAFLSRMKRTTRWKLSLVCPSIKTIRPSQCRRCLRRLRPVSYPAQWTLSWTTTWWTLPSQETVCRSLAPTAACQARREASPLAPSGTTCTFSIFVRFGT